MYSSKLKGVLLGQMGHLTLELVAPAVYKPVLLLGEWMVKTHFGSRLFSAMDRSARLVILANSRAPMLMATANMMVMDNMNMSMGVGRRTGSERMLRWLVGAAV
jgi:hypothetical protein